jgi:hypothetical protein
MASEPPRSQTDSLEEGRNRLRETIKWLIASFGAIGASLAIGSQISHVGTLSDSRLALALLGVVMAFAGILLAIWVAVKVMTGSYVSLGDLAKQSRAASNDGKPKAGLVKFLESDNSHILQPYKSVGDLADKFNAASAGGDEVEYARISGIVRVVVNAAAYEQLRMKFDSGLPVIMAGAALAVAGITLFAWAANPGELSGAKIENVAFPAAAQPVPATLSLTPEGWSSLKSELGVDCGPTDIPVLVVSSEATGIEVISLPTANCQLRRWLLTPTMGTLLSSEPACELVTDDPGLARRLECSSP